MSDFVTGYVYDESGNLVGLRLHQSYPVETQAYLDYPTNRAFKRMKMNEAWTEWIEIEMV